MIARYRPTVLGAVRGLAARGTEVECPCCEGRFRAFRAHRGRSGAKCPRCGALERHRALWLWLARETDLLRAELSLLHIAPEYELQRRLAKLPNLRYLSADLDSPLAMVRTDVLEMQFEDESFDVVMCNHVLEHVADDRRALSEILRVLRPGGWSVLLVPIERHRAVTFEDPAITDPAERLRIYGQEDHARVYGRDYPERLRRAGFEVEVIDPSRNCPPAQIRSTGLVRDGHVEEIYVARKPRV